MRIKHKDFPGKQGPLKSIEIQGDSLLWSYQSGLFTQNASVPISSLVSVHFEHNELIWAYRIFASDGSGRVDELSETLSAVGQCKLENDHLSGIHWKLLEVVNPREFQERSCSKQNSERHNGKGSKNSQGDKSAGDKDFQECSNTSGAGSSPGSPGQNYTSNSPPGVSLDSRSELKRALSVIGGRLAREKKRKLKSTLRLVHHPDHGGDQEFFIRLEAVLVELDW